MPPTSGLNNRERVVPQNSESAQSVKIVESRANHRTVDFRFAELNRKIQRSIQDGVEIVRGVRVLPEIFGLNVEPWTELLLKAYVVLVASCWRERLNARRSKSAVAQPTGASGARYMGADHLRHPPDR